VFPYEIAPCSARGVRGGAHNQLTLAAWARVEGERMRERERLCVCVCVCERERERERVRVCVCEREREREVCVCERESVCVCVCVCEREREKWSWKDLAEVIRRDLAGDLITREDLDVVLPDFAGYVRQDGLLGFRV
jgi:hypothetical protein